jgi:hypothetical protein
MIDNWKQHKRMNNYVIRALNWAAADCHSVNRGAVRNKTEDSLITVLGWKNLLTALVTTIERLHLNETSTKLELSFPIPFTLLEKVVCSIVSSNALFALLYNSFFLRRIWERILEKFWWCGCPRWICSKGQMLIESPSYQGSLVQILEDFMINRADLPLRFPREHRFCRFWNLICLMRTWWMK